MEKPAALTTPVGIVLPERPLHTEYIILSVRIAMLFTSIAVVFGVALALTIATIAIAPLAMMFSVITVAVLFASIPIISIVRRAVNALEWYREQSTANQDAARANATRALEAQMIVASGRATVNVNSPATTNTTNQIAVITENKTQTRREFIEHYREMIERGQFLVSIGEAKTGFEARLFLKDVPNGVSDYQFRDGNRITRDEYNQLIEFGRANGAVPESRRRGSAGQPTPPKLIDAAN